MKEFFQTFVVIFILIIIFLFFGQLILESFWATVAFIAFIISILVTTFIHQETRIEELEKRIKALEPQNGEKEQE